MRHEKLISIINRIVYLGRQNEDSYKKDMRELTAKIWVALTSEESEKFFYKYNLDNCETQLDKARKLLIELSNQVINENPERSDLLNNTLDSVDHFLKYNK